MKRRCYNCKWYNARKQYCFKGLMHKKATSTCIAHEFKKNIKKKVKEQS